MNVPCKMRIHWTHHLPPFPPKAIKGKHLVSALQRSIPPSHKWFPYTPNEDPIAEIDQLWKEARKRRKWRSKMRRRKEENPKSEVPKLLAYFHVVLRLRMLPDASFLTNSSAICQNYPRIPPLVLFTALCFCTLYLFSITSTAHFPIASF